MLTNTERQRLRADAQYLNLAEMRGFCERHGLPLHVHVERPDGSSKRTRDRDRKDIVLDRMLAFALRGRRKGPTIYSASVIASGKLPVRITAGTRVHYGQYEKQNERFVARMKQLTGDRFRLGMIARLVLRDFWTAGQAPTMREFAAAWTAAADAHTQPRPEGAYLVDVAKGEAGPGWKKLRAQRARRALRMLRRLVAARRTAT